MIWIFSLLLTYISRSIFHKATKKSRCRSLPLIRALLSPPSLPSYLSPSLSLTLTQVQQEYHTSQVSSSAGTGCRCGRTWWFSAAASTAEERPPLLLLLLPSRRPCHHHRPKAPNPTSTPRTPRSPVAQPRSRSYPGSVLSRCRRVRDFPACARLPRWGPNPRGRRRRPPPPLLPLRTSFGATA